MDVIKSKKGAVTSPKAQFGTIFNKNKKGFAFSFIIFFLSIILFATIHLNMANDDLNKEDVFVNSRIAFVNDEIYYLKSTYLNNIVQYSFYNTMDALTNYSSDVNNLKKLNKNYSQLNNWVYEGMTNASFEGNNQLTLENKTIFYFMDQYINSFNKNNNANLTLNITNINVYENKPYFLSLQLLINLSVETADNISSWNSLEYYYVDVPIDNLPVPDFLYYNNIKIPSKSAEYNLPDTNWTLDTFSDAINLSYSSVFIEEDHRYSVGKSYLKRLLNISYGSYQDVIASYNFDYDLETEECYDTSLYNNFSLRYGNSFGIYHMENISLIGNILPDNSDYSHNLTLFNGVDCNKTGIIGTSCFLDGENDYMKTQNFMLIDDDISVFAWVNLSNSSMDDYQKIVCTKDSYFCYFYNALSNNIEVVFNGTSQKSGGTNHVVFEDINITLGQWNHIGFTYDGNLTLLYVNSLRYYSEVMNAGSDNYYGNLSSVIGDIYIGTDEHLSYYLNGSVDEVGIFNKLLNKEEIGELFDKRKVVDMDYVNVLHNKGRFFDGKDDYINLGDNSIYDFNNQKVGLEFWLRLNNISGKQVLVDKGQDGGNGWGVMIDNGKINLTNHGISVGTVNNPINKTDYFYHIVVNAFDGSMEVFVNNKEYITTAPGGSAATVTGYNLTIGKRSDSDTEFFNGVMDEFRIYNRSITKQEVENNYKNYDSLAKGCCNYILLVNPNKLGYNTTAYKNNVSYSTKIFYDYYELGKSYNISLYNLTNITSFNTDKFFYNFIFDDCVNYAFSTSDYQLGTGGNISLDLYKLDGVDEASCSNLVKLGVY